MEKVIKPTLSSGMESLPQVARLVLAMVRFNLSRLATLVLSNGRDSNQNSIATFREIADLSTDLLETQSASLQTIALERNVRSVKRSRSVEPDREQINLLDGQGSSLPIRRT